MTKDYAKKRRVSANAKARTRYTQSAYDQSQPFMPAWIWMSAGLLMGITLSGVVYWKLHKTNPSRPPITVEMQDSKGAKIATQSKAIDPKKSDSSRFDFYTMLPATNIDEPAHLQEADPLKTDPLAQVAAAPKTETLAQVAAAPISAKPENNLKPEFNYIIQAGAFKQRSQAEALKAQLALAGLEASIQTVKIDGRELRYRVNVGPFDSKDKATAKQKHIEQAHRLHSFIVKSHV